MSVPSELIMNTQNSFQTHAQRGANIVQRGGQKGRKWKIKKFLRKEKRKEQAEKKRLAALHETPEYKKWLSENIKEAEEKHRPDGRDCDPMGGHQKVMFKSQEFGTATHQLGQCARGSKCKRTDDFNEREGICVSASMGGKKKSKRTKRMARKSRRRQTRKNKRGGGRTITFENLNHMANSRLGKMVPHGNVYTNCNTQSGGAGFGFTREGAADAATFKGSYPAVQKYEKSKQCGGRRRRRKSRRKKRKSRKKRRKSRRKRRRTRRRRRRRRRQRGGSSASYAAPFAGGEKPWATAPVGIQKNGASCYDNYNHYKGL